MSSSNSPLMTAIRIAPLYVRVQMALLVSCSCASAQSLATVGENDAIAVSVGYVSNSRVSGPVFIPGGFGANTFGSRISGPTLGVGVSGAKVFELSGQIAWLGGDSKPVSLELGSFPHSGKQSGGFGVVSGLSFDLEEGHSDPVFKFGGVFYLSEEFSKTFLSARFEISHNEMIGSASPDETFWTLSFGFEFGFFNDEKASPFISLAGAKADNSSATHFSATAGMRLPIFKKKKVKVSPTPGLPDKFD